MMITKIDNIMDVMLNSSCFRQKALVFEVVPGNEWVPSQARVSRTG